MLYTIFWSEYIFYFDLGNFHIKPKIIKMIFPDYYMVNQLDSCCYNHNTQQLLKDINVISWKTGILYYRTKS